MDKVRSVEETSSGLVVKFENGGSRTLSTGSSAQLVRWDDEGVTYRQNGEMKHYSFRTSAYTRL
ncbi:hypothetical protein IJ541_07355 [bacterium]|nr:hypothetical protein [bacterium]